MSEEISFQSIVLAAGKGTRMKSERAKVLHEVLGRPMIGHVVDTALEAGASRAVVVLGHEHEKVQAWLEATEDADRLHYVHQEEQLGTAHAVWTAKPFLEADDAPSYTLILSGDVPNMDTRTLRNFMKHTLAAKSSLGVMTAVLDEPDAYGRMLRDENSELTGIVEFRDATEAERDIHEINAGIYFAKTDFLAKHLPELCGETPDNAQGEFYLTDLVARAAGEDGAFGWPVPKPELTRGVNTRVDLAAANKTARETINHAWMLNGVTLIDPDRTIIEADVALYPDTCIYPDVHLRGKTVIANGAVIENGCVISDSTIGANVHVKPYSHIEESAVDADSQIGPFAHLRPGADVGKGCKVGNFVEVKKSRLDDGVKASHLTYLGDAHVGHDANIGAGTITCNYDGKRKNHTEIGPFAFIGSNTALVAPVSLGESAYIGAGSVITDNVPDDALAVARGRQRNIEGWGRRVAGNETRQGDE